MAEYIYFIIVVALLFLLDSVFFPKKVSFFTHLGIFIVIVFVILREGVGYDYENYVAFLREEPSAMLSRAIEIGFVSVVWIIRFFNASHFWLFALFGISIILLTARGIHLYTVNFRIAFFVYLLIPGLFLNSLSILRQAIAIALVFNSFYYYYNKDKLRFGFWYCFATLFHYSTLLALPGFLLAPKFKNKVTLLVAILIPLSLAINKLGVINSVLGLLFAASKYGAYETFTDGGTSWFKIVALNGSLLVWVCFLGKYNMLTKTLFVLVVFSVALTNVFSEVAAVTRISYYYKIFEIVLVANTLKSIRTPSYRTMATVAFVGYYFTMYLSALITDLNLDYSPKLIPYQSII